MADDGPLKELVRKLSAHGILVASDVDPALLQGLSIETISAKIAERHRGSGQLIINNEELRDVISGVELEKAPVPVEVARTADFKPVAADVDAIYSLHNREPERSEGTVDDFVSYFRSRLRSIRSLIEGGRGSTPGLLTSIERTKDYANGREVALVGMVSSKITTKNNNIMVVLEDETSEAKVIFMNSPAKQALFESARSILDDEVLAVRGRISGPFIIASEIVWPDIPIREKKKTDDDIAIAFISDIHVGSKKFLEKNFLQFIRWLNGGLDVRKDLASKVKYVVAAGDVVDGIGIYPNQDRDLAVLDVYTQYRMLFNMLGAIPDYIHVFVLPGNHDAVQRAEPQPQITKELAGEFKSDNIHLLPSPSYTTLHGLEVLSYHGTSLDSIIRGVPNTSYSAPEKAMVEVLKRRHLSPVHGGNIVVPSKRDNMVIERIPDILHMGHIHKNGIANYHGVEIVNSGTWQARTSYQVQQGHIPTPCIVPIYEARQGTFSQVNFSGADV